MDQLRNGNPTQTDAKVRLAGPEQVVFAWSRDACSPDDIPDAAARAFRDATGRVHLISSSFVTRAEVGPSLNRVAHDCRVVLDSGDNPDPSAYDYHEWLAAPYTVDGRTVFALVHEEYHGHEHPGRCQPGPQLKCWYNSITMAVSRDGGNSFSHPAAPHQLVATVPYPYEPNADPYGLFQPSNIVLKDRYYYSLVRAERFNAQPQGACLIRTRNLSDPASWRGWDGKGFSIRFADPYRPLAGSAKRHVCEPVSHDFVQGMTDSLTYNTYLHRFLLVGVQSVPGSRSGSAVPGFYFSLSKDLIHWTSPKLIKRAEFPWTYRCGGADPALYPSVLDPRSRSRSFETTGRRAYLYFVRFHYYSCRQTQDRDLVRVPIEFSR